MASDYDLRLTQQAQIGAIYGRAQATATAAEHESASHQWAEAWSRLKRAEAAQEHATNELGDARTAEQAAWNVLEGTAGRAPVPPKQACDPRRF